MKKYILLIAVIGFISTSCTTHTHVRAPQTQQVVVVKKVPRQHKVVYVKGKRYYNWGGNHYRKTRRGYVLVRF